MGLAAHIQSHLQRWLSSVQPLKAGDVGMDAATGRSRLWVGGFAQSVAVLGDLSGATPIQQQLAAGFARLGNPSGMGSYTTDWTEMVVVSGASGKGQYFERHTAGGGGDFQDLMTINGDGDPGFAGGVLHQHLDPAAGDYRLFLGNATKRIGLIRLASTSKFYCSFRVRHQNAQFAAGGLFWLHGLLGDAGVATIAPYAAIGLETTPSFRVWAVLSSATTETFIVTNPVDATWYTFELWGVGDGHLHAAANGVEIDVVPLATSWPNAFLTPGKFINNGAGATMDCYTDWDVYIYEAAS